MILLSLLLVAAQAPQSSTAADRAGKFSLDLPADDTVIAPADPKTADPKPAGVPPADPAPVTRPTTTHFSLDTPIADLLADPGARAVLDKDMPGLSTDDNLPKFSALSLRRLAPLSGGQMTADLMGKLAYDLAALGGGAPPPGAKKPTGPVVGR
ncbi:hypothetical protein D9601_00825 [Sphingomonas sp. MA1305]|uniref:hypothetical protein n=1 Tax=Sphingomonas sp. MA1305 TaxID=2479204 RepID=UPI0018DFD632|nr:hypothetical protein [Sphingomonas sp. MA1305]MBI0473906.1 hypothetical protein [Sphingomonas sp. MA1305]